MNLAIAGGTVMGAVEQNHRNPLIEFFIRIARSLNQKGDPL